MGALSIPGLQIQCAASQHCTAGTRPSFTARLHCTCSACPFPIDPTLAARPILDMAVEALDKEGGITDEETRSSVQGELDGGH